MALVLNHSLKEQDSHIPIAFAFDKNYLIPAGACIYSLLESIAKASKRVCYTLYALVVGLNEQDIAKLHQIAEPFKEFAALEVRDVEPFLDTIPNPFDEDFTKRFSKMVLVKYFLADLFPEYSKMVWSDADVIFCREFSADFLNIKEDDENYFHGVLEVEKNHMMEGFLFCNLGYQREKNFALKMHELLKRNKAKEELDFTKWCWPNMKALGIEYCVFPWYYTIKDFSNAYLNENYKKTILEARKNPIIIHYDAWWGAVKPWDYPFGLKADLWLNALAKTPFMSDYTKQIHINESFYTTKMAQQHYFSSTKSSKDILFKTPYLFFKSYLFVVFKERKIHSKIFDITCTLVKRFFNKLIHLVFFVSKSLVIRAVRKILRILKRLVFLVFFISKKVVSKILKVLGLHGIVKKILIKLLKKS
ncbi:glycosyltransferase [Helicobacter acinonychis]|uniref:glycosyltransferase n=1 Tax=Helicobacter acinonychis TaxID=212 RepID=UPI000CF1B8F8|nr:glycosyltransferase family 8 protein [Helicobacter acinonychis]